MSATPTRPATAATAETVSDAGPRLRVIFMVTVAEDLAERFLAAYDTIADTVAKVPGHLEDQVARSTTDPTRWVITSLWENAAAFETWERSSEHRTLVAPLRACLTDPTSLRFAVQRHTS